MELPPPPSSSPSPTAVQATQALRGKQDEIAKLQSELEESHRDLARDEEIFAKKMLELESYKAHVQQLSSQNAQLVEQLTAANDSEHCGSEHPRRTSADELSAEADANAGTTSTASGGGSSEEARRRRLVPQTEDWTCDL